MTAHDMDRIIDGLDIMVCDKDGLRWVDKNEKNVLIERSAQINDSIRSQLFA